MSTNLSPGNALFLASVDHIQRRLAIVNSQMSSGKRLQSAADDPGQLPGLLQLRTDLAHNQQIEANLTLAGTDADGADSAISSAIGIMDRATQLAAEGANGTQTQGSRNALAQEVQSLMEQMVSLSQTQVQGRYIFSGDSDGSISYKTDFTAPTGVTQVSSAAATRVIEDPAGGAFAATQTAAQIFDDTVPASIDANGDPVAAAPAADNVFAALNGLRLALLNNDQAGVQNAVVSVKAASNHLNNAQAFYGTVEDRIQSAVTFASKYDTQLKTEIGNIEDADPTAAALELSQNSTQLQAAFEMQAKIPTQTLFNFLG
jgi:flagellar hook-associated protein 3 FlgL